MSPNPLRMLLQIDHDITRHFEFDYNLFDALFWACWVALLVHRKRYAALEVGAIWGRLVHLVDEPIATVRHMQSQVIAQVTAAIVGYALLVGLRYDWGRCSMCFGWAVCSR